MEIEIQSKTVDGHQVNDTVYHTISGFSLLDQDSNQVSENIFKGKIHIANFMFTNFLIMVQIWIIKFQYFV